MTISPDQFTWLVNFYSHFLDGLPDESVTDWACKNVVFDEPGNNGPFRIEGREFMREPLDSFKDFSITHAAIVSGTQVGKTATLMAGMAWLMYHVPLRALWVMPTTQLAQDFSSTRWMASLRATPCFADSIPHGAERGKFSTLRQIMRGFIVNFVGSNSPGNLSSRPAQVVIQDEVSKFPSSSKGEANASALADERTKDAVRPKHIKTSTPILETDLIWQQLLMGDVRKYFMPCPHCGKEVIFAFGKDYTVLPLTGAEACVEWDKEAKRDKSWDLDRVERSARYVCPWCREKGLDGHIGDGNKPWMIRNGVWKPTQKCEAGRISWHLPSFYAATPQTRVGQIAVKFLKDKESAQGLQSIVNNYFAEPWCNQDTAGERIEILIHNNSHISEDAAKIMTVDCQLVSPLFWFVIREWIPAGEHKGDSRGILSGHVDSLADLSEIQNGNKVSHVKTGLDAGNNQDSVIADFCLQYGEFIKGRFNDIPFPVWKGWIPCKGQKKKLWKNKMGLYVPYSFCDLYRDRGPQKVCIKMLLHSGDYCKDIMSRLRKHEHTLTEWQVSDACGTPEYWKHLDAEVLTMVGTQMIWKPRYQKAANHLGDCEALQIALAIYNGYLTYSRDFTPQEKPDNSKARETKEYTLAKS